MKNRHWLALIAALALLLLAAPLARATAYHTITVDGDMGDWAADEEMEAAGPYTLYLTWDANNLYLGLTGAYLGDDPAQDKSFFVCFDTDLTPGSGAPADGYGNVLFNTNFLAPEYCYYFAGGAGWYEWSVWDPLGQWLWQPWRSDGTYYNWPGNPASLPGSELTIQRSDIGNPGAVGVVAWLTAEADPAGPGIPVEAAWPTGNPTGSQPILEYFYFYPDLSYTGGVSPDIAVGAQGDHVVINEFVAKGTEWVELYNPTSSSVDISGWLLTSDYGNLSYTIPGGTVLPPGGYYVSPTGGAFLHNDGDVIRLATMMSLVDVVGYGIRGAAPIPPQFWGAARVPNGQDTDDDARDWNLDETETPGAVNDAPPVDLGSSLSLNEFDNYPPSGNDKVEIYNPTSTTITLTNWLLSDGDAVAPIVTAVAVPPGGWLVLEETVDWTATMDFAASDVGYLFRPDGTRVDQIGWYNESEDGTFQRICDGAGPNDGYNWSSSGGGVTWFDLPQTLGGTNTPGPVDVKVDKVGPLSVLPGGLITYVVTYQAANPMPATALLLTDTLPDNVVYLGYTALPTITLLSTDPLVWDAGSRCGYAMGILTITAQVSGTVLPGTVLTNTVEITAAGDVNPANNTDLVTTTVVGSEVGVAKSCPADPFLPGQIVTYTLAYNVTGEPAQSLVLTDVLPVGVTYLSDSSGITPTQPTTGTLVWAMGTVTDSGSFLITAVVSTNPLTWTFTNQAWISATNDSIPANNYAACSNQGPLPIQEIQRVPDPASNDTSPYVGQWVWVEGVATAGSDVFLSGSGAEIRYYIEDPAGGPWSGLYVYKGSSHPSVQEGDQVLLHGLVAEYQGVTELDLTGAGGVQIVVSSGNPLPAPEILATGAYTPTGPATAEAYESVLIEFQGAVVTNDNLGFGEWAFDDGSGEAHADDWSHYLTYVPALGDLYGFIRGIGNYSYGEYKLVPRYDPDIDLDYAVTLIYHDLEQVVPDGVTMHIAGNFNGWSTTATLMLGDGSDDIYSATFALDNVPYSLEYKYVAGDNWNDGRGDILNTDNRQATITAPTTLHDYRKVRAGYAKLNGPSPITIELGDPTPVITGEAWFSNLPFGPNQVLVAELGYGTGADLNTWTWAGVTFSGRVGNNDLFAGSLTPTTAGVYSFAIRFDGNWATGNPNSTWYPGDLDGVYPGDPFEPANTGILTVVAPELTINKMVTPTEGVGLGSVVTYTLVLENSGTGDARGVLLTDALPVEVDFGGWVQQNGAVQANDLLTWTGNVSVGVELTFIFTATVGDDEAFSGRTVTNTASFVSDNAGSGSDGAAFVILAPERYHVYLPLVVKGP